MSWGVSAISCRGRGERGVKPLLRQIQPWLWRHHCDVISDQCRHALRHADDIKTSRAAFRPVQNNVVASTHTHSCSLSLYHTCDSITIRLRYDDTTTHSITTEVIELTICVRFDCDTTLRLRSDYDVSRACFHSTRFNTSKKWTCQFFVVVVSQSYRSRIAIVI